MQSQEPPEFRFTPQVAIIIAITLIALIIPVTGVVLVIKGMLVTPVTPKSEETVSAGSLQTALEDVASKNLTPPPLTASDQKVELTAKDPAQEAQRIENLARIYGSTALPTSSEDDKRRLLVQISAQAAPTFINACRHPEVEPGVPAITNEQARILVEIVIAKATSS